MSKTFYIIDGHSHLYAAYYAIRNLSSPSGEPTNATYGMTSVVLKLLRDNKPDYLVAVFDPPGKTFRFDIYEQYKANRPPMPDDLSIQVKRIAEVLTALSVPVIVVDGFEADDVIATLCKLAREQQVETFICSKDKDLEQLLSPDVKMYDTKEDRVLDAAKLNETKGITPQQVVDALALIGDPVDNVPGVPGVGPKTAVKLVQKYGSLDAIIAHADELSGKIKTFLDEKGNVEKLMLSRKLVTLRDDAPVAPRWDQWRVRPADPEKVRTLFTQLGFSRFLEQLGVRKQSKEVQESARTGAPVCELICDESALDKLLSQLAGRKLICVDTETTGVNPVDADLVGISVSWQAGKAYYIPVRASDGRCLPLEMVVRKLKPILEDPDIGKCGQNLKYDITVLKNVGIELAGIEFDTMIASYVLNPQRGVHNLDALAEIWLGYHTTKIAELIGKGQQQLTLDLVDTQQVAQYAGEDAEVAYRLRGVLAEQLKQHRLEKLFREVEMPLVQVLAEMEFNGVAIDTQVLARMSNSLADQVSALTRRIHESVGHQFNLDSPKQLAEVLFDKLGLPVVKRTRTGRSTDVAVLEQLAGRHEVPKLILEYRQLSKLKNTYVDTLPEMISPRTGRLHASFNQTVTATGRLSSSDPNLQNIPIRTELGRQIRAAFVPSQPHAVLLTSDYSQVELRLLAHFSRDEQLTRAFHEDQDIHAFVASQVFGVPLGQVTGDQRRVAKTVNFGIIYGQTPFGLAKTLGISRTEAERFIKAYFKKYAGVRAFIDQCIKQARDTGHVRTILDRRRPIPEIASKNPAQRSFAERTAVNTVVQGSAADLIKIAMINIHRLIKQKDLPAKMLIQVHDELVFEVPQEQVHSAAEQIEQQMCTALKLNVPLKVDLAWGKNWMEVK